MGSGLYERAEKWIYDTLSWRITKEDARQTLLEEYFKSTATKLARSREREEEVVTEGRSSRGSDTGRAIGCLGAVLILLGFLLYLSVSEWRSANRSAEAPVEVIRAEYANPWWSGRTEGYQISYRYHVAGKSHEATEALSTAYDPEDATHKVCYDPSDPAKVALERAVFECGEDWQHHF